MKFRYKKRFRLSSCMSVIFSAITETFQQKIGAPIKKGMGKREIALNLLISIPSLNSLWDAGRLHCRSSLVSQHDIIYPTVFIKANYMAVSNNF